MTMGCLGRIGCLILVVCIGVGAWMTRAMWLPDSFREHPPVGANAWQPISQAGAARTRAALDKLNQPRGPVYQSVSAGDVASLAFAETIGQKSDVDSVEARISGAAMLVRARVATGNFRDKLGPLAGIVKQRETVELTGTFNMLQPGTGEFVVNRAMVGQVTLPSGMIPRLVREIDKRPRPEGTAENALPLPVPTYVSDIRIANGKVTLYKNVK
jgi:hypothetical protein